jgi:hypothetical protein
LTTTEIWQLHKFISQSLSRYFLLKLNVAGRLKPEGNLNERAGREVDPGKQKVYAKRQGGYQQREFFEWLP